MERTERYLFFVVLASPHDCYWVKIKRNGFRVQTMAQRRDFSNPLCGSNPSGRFPRESVQFLSVKIWARESILQDKLQVVFPAKDISSSSILVTPKCYFQQIIYNLRFLLFISYKYSAKPGSCSLNIIVPLNVKMLKIICYYKVHQQMLYQFENHNSWWLSAKTAKEKQTPLNKGLCYIFLI